jgi:DNA-binding CsgD family transcriptional regulator
MRRTGRLKESLALLKEVEELSELDSGVHRLLALGFAVTLHHLGQDAESEAWCRQLEPAPDGALDWGAEMDLLCIQADSRLRAGDAHGARELIHELRATADRAGVAEPCVVPWQSIAIAAELRCGYVSAADEIVASVESSCQRLLCLWPRIVVATGRALLAERAGNHSVADEQFRHALQFHCETQLRLAEADTLTEYGRFLARRGRDARAREVLGEAVRLAERCSAGALAQTAHAELKLLGGRRRHRTDPNSLTISEVRVAELAASGRTNKEVARHLGVGEGTVETHLHGVFAKLGITSRHQLRSRLSQLTPH